MAGKMLHQAQVSQAQMGEKINVAAKFIAAESTGAPAMRSNVEVAFQFLAKVLSGGMDEELLHGDKCWWTPGAGG